MSNARDNVPRRLSSTSSDTGGNAQSTDNVQSTEVSQTTVDDKTSRPKAIVMFSSIDPELYNPDGSLRTVHTMPPFEARWEEAKKATYVRTKNLRDCERELSVQEIFAKPSE